MRLRGAKVIESSIRASPISNGTPRKKVVPSEPLHMTTRAAASKTASVTTGSRRASMAAPSVAPSLGSDESRRNSAREVTLNVGGSDIDSTRPSKHARMSLRNSRRISGSNSSSSRDIGVSNRDDFNSRKSSLAEISTTDRVDIRDTIDKVTPLNVAQTAMDKVSDGPPTSSVRHSPTKRAGKGTRNLRGVFVNGSSARVESPGTPSRMFDGDLTDRQSPGRNENGGVQEKLPGRKRAQHPDSEVEVALRRQLELKVAYRTVVKALKPILVELANRTTREAAEDEESFKSHPEYEDIIQQLDNRMEERFDLLNSYLREEEGRLRREKLARDQIIHRQFAQALQDHRDDFLLHCQHEYLSISREAVVEEDDNATQYEVDIIPSLYTMERVSQPQITVDRNILQDTSAPRIARIPLSPEYESRSRVFVETERLWDEFDARQNLGMKLHDYDPKVFVRKPKNFAVFDGAQRTLAEICLNLNSLIEAGKEVEEVTKPVARKSAKVAKHIANADAIGLQALASAIDMTPSMPAHIAHPSLITRANVESPAGQLPGHYVNANYKITSEPLKKPVMPPLRSEIFGTDERPPQMASTAPNPHLPYIQQRVTFGARNTFVSPYPAPQNSPQPQYAPIHPPQYAPFHPPQPPQHAVRDEVQRGNMKEAPPGKPQNQRGQQMQPERHGTRHSHTSERHQYYDRPAQELSHMMPTPIPLPPVSAVEATRTLPRKRPGPRPHYSSQVEPDVAPHLHGGQQWRPFTNTMGPPTHLPRYIMESEPAHNSPPPSSIAPHVAPQNAPKLTIDQRNKTQNSHHERRISAERPRPSENHYVPIPLSEKHARSLPAMRSIYPHENIPHYSSPGDSHHRVQQQQPQQPPPQRMVPNSPRSVKPDLTMPPPQSQSNQLPPIFATYHQQSGGHYGPIHYHDAHGRQSQSGSLRSTTIPSNTNYPPPPPAPQPSNYFPGQPAPTQAHPPPPSLQQSQLQQQYHVQSHSRTSSLPALAPSLPPLAPDLRPQSRHESFSHAAVGRHLQQQPGQAGHQPILPATLDPSRRKSQFGTATSPSIAGAPIPGASQAVVSGLQGQRPLHQEWRNYTSILPAPSTHVATTLPMSSAPPTTGNVSYAPSLAPLPTNFAMPPQSIYPQSGPHYQQHHPYPMPHPPLQHPQHHYFPPYPQQTHYTNAQLYEYPSHAGAMMPGSTATAPAYTKGPSSREKDRKITATVAAFGSNSRGKVREWRFQTGQGRASRGGKRGNGGTSGSGGGASRRASTVGKGDVNVPISAGAGAGAGDRSNNVSITIDGSGDKGSGTSASLGLGAQGDTSAASLAATGIDVAHAATALQNSEPKASSASSLQAAQSSSQTLAQAEAQSKATAPAPISAPVSATEVSASTHQLLASAHATPPPQRQTTQPPVPQPLRTSSPIPLAPSHEQPQPQPSQRTSRPPTPMPMPHSQSPTA